MNVAFLTMGKDIGGAAQDVITLTQGLVSRGHTVFVISRRGVLDKELAGTPVRFIDAPLYTRNPIGLWKASRKIRRIVLSHEIELLNPQGMFTAFSSWLATIGWKRDQFKIVTTIHMISQLRLYKYSWALNIFSDRIITESNCERNRLTGGGVCRKSISVISNAVDMDYFSRSDAVPVLRKEYTIPEDYCCFGIIARLSKEKRHIDFIHAAVQVHNVNPKTVFFIIGDGPESEQIRKMTEGTEEFIMMTGKRRDIPDVLCSLDCFVLTSEIESLPLSIREAMSMELPVITTDVGGVREAVLHGITGLVVSPYNVQQLVDSMLKLAEDEALRHRMGKKGHELCRIGFELGNWAEKTEQLFEEVLKN